MLEYNYDLQEGSCCIGFVQTAQQAKFPFYITTLGHYLAGPNYYTRRSESSGYLLLYSRRGVGLVQIEQEQITLPAGSILLIDCGVYHSYATRDARWDMYWIHLEGTGTAGFHQLFREQDALTLPVQDPETLCTSLNRFLKMPEILSIGELSAQSLAMHRLLSGLLENHLAFTDREGFNRMEEAAAYLRLHYQEPLHLEGIAEQFYLSKYHFIRRFKAYTGLPPYQYLMHYRVVRAQALLQSTDLSVSEIASHVGFSSTNSLLTHFRNLTGTTPGAYRKHPRSDLPAL